MFDYEKNKALVTDSKGQRLTVGLFEELSRDDVTAKPAFLLSDWRKKYVELSDPTGYQAAMELLGDWDHWQLLCENKRFAEHLAKWNLEVEAKLRSAGVVQLMKQSKGPQGTAAARWLAEAGFVERDKRKKKDKAEEEAMSKEVKTRTNDDAKRLGLSVVSK